MQRVCVSRPFTLWHPCCHPEPRAAAQEAAGCPVRLGRGENGKVVAGQARRPRRFGQLAAGREPFLPEGGTRRKQKMRSALPVWVSQLWAGEEVC